MIELSVVGTKNSGKTTLIEQLIPLLKSSGMRVATVKHTSHDHTFDTTGKDSHRHRAAGSEITMAVSSTELALFSTNDAQIKKDMHKLISRHAHLCLIEGDKFSDRAKLLVTVNKDEAPDPMPDNIMATFGSLTISNNVPHFSKDQLGQLVDHIVNFCSKTEGSMTTND